jgi:hypothetical protein
VVTTQPEVLVGVSEAVAEVAEGFGGGFVLAEAATGDQIIHEVGGANGQLGEEFRAVEEEEQHFEDGWVAVPELEESGTGAIGTDKAIEAGHDAVGVGEAGWRGAAGEREKHWEELGGQLNGAWGDMDVAGTFDEFAKDAKGFINIFKIVGSQ